MAFGLAGLAATYPGFLGAQEESADIGLKELKNRALQNEMIGQQQRWLALQAMFGGPQMTPPPMPGQPSIPGMPSQSPMGVGGSPATMGGGPALGGMSGPRPPLAGPLPQPGGQPPGPGSMAGGGPPSFGGGAGGGMGPQGSSGLNWQTIIQSLSRQAGPGVPPEALAAAVDQFVPMMNQESKLQWQEMRNQLQLTIAQEKLDSAWRIAHLRDRGADRRSGMGLGEGDMTEQLARLGWDEDTIVDAARTFNATGKMPTNLGTRQTAGMIRGAIQNMAHKLLQESGITPEQRAENWQKYAGGTQYQRSAGTYGARVEAASNEVDQLMPQALEASRSLPRGSWVPVNKLIQQFEAGTSDPNYYDFAFANWSLVNAYTRAINPTGVPRLDDKKHALELMSIATDQKSYERVLERMAKEVAASKKAISQTRESTGGKPLSSGKKTEDRVPPAAGPTLAPQTGSFDREAAKRAGYTDDEIDRFLAGK